MPSDAALLSGLECHPVTPDRWGDLEALFGHRGASGGCWCMWWRVTRAQYEKQKGEGNRTALKGIVESGQVPGILAYAGGQAVAWCSLGPREAYPRLERSRTLKRVDDEPVWSVVCFYVARPFRRRGVMAPLLTSALQYAKARGARTLEGYPIEPQAAYPTAFAYTGLASAFRRVGFVEVARRSPTRPIMRRSLEQA